MNILMLGKGYLTYAMAFSAIVVGISGFVMGILDDKTAITVVWAGLSVFGLRRAI